MGSGSPWDNVKLDNFGIFKQWVDASLDLDDGQSKAGSKHIFYNIKW
jgi:hypothetical protein